MKAKTFTVVGSTGGPTYTPAWIVDSFNNPTCIGIGAVVSGLESIADIQFTFADWASINLNVVSAAPWQNDATLVSATQANSPNYATTNYAFPPVALRGRVRALASAGAGNRVTFTFHQAGPEE
jgi:hypothetical protein